MEKITPQDGWLLQRDRAVAWLRVAFALVAVTVIPLNPSRLSTFPTLSLFSLGSFFIYSLAILELTRRKKFTSGSILRLVTTCFDLIWITLIVFSTGGTRTPFFFYFSFPVITASVRWGLKGSIPVALVEVALYGAIRFSLAAEALDPPIGIDTFLVRSIYLLVLACIFGYISEFEKKQNQRLLALSRTAGEAAVLVERRNITHDLHDGLLQSLATLILRLETCRQRFPDSPNDLVRELQSMEDSVRGSMNEIRQVLAGNHSYNCPPGMLIEKLREEMKFLHDGLGLDVIIESEPEDLQLHHNVEREIFYVLREALMNVAKHSHATQAEMYLKQTDGTLEGTLRDNGVGFDRVKPTGPIALGLKTMEERINKLGGELLIKSSAGEGTKISFVVPLRPA
jgi:signal transduction histidine kinase